MKSSNKFNLNGKTALILDRGIISPQQYIALLEQTNIILTDISQTSLEKAYELMQNNLDFSLKDRVDLN